MLLDKHTTLATVFVKRALYCFDKITFGVWHIILLSLVRNLTKLQRILQFK